MQPAPRPTGLHLISSNRVELLLAALADEIVDSPPASPFCVETVVVPNPAMARWVNLQLARTNGIAINLHYPLPASWIWETARALIPDLPDRDPLHPEFAAWKIYRLLPDLLDQKAFGGARRYLHNDMDGIKRWQLSQKIAGLYDRYQFHRPELIRAWCAGQDCGWQALLWRKLLDATGSGHRIEVIDRMLEILTTQDLPSAFPERIALFAISSLPPVFVEVIHALAGRTRVLLFMHSPSAHYWADLNSKKSIARIRLQSPDKAAYYHSASDEHASELLASWGRQGQILQDLLLSAESLDSLSTELYRAPVADCLLHRIQCGILSLSSEIEYSAPDASLQLHSCHSPLRECQVLHDQLLAILDADRSLRPEDILILIPDIGRYAPYVEAVFSKSENATRPFIPWNLSDLSLAEQHPLIETCLYLLGLPDSRFTASEVLSLLDLPELSQCFALERRECEAIRDLIDRARVFWGLDGAHKSAFGLPQIEENTWRHAGRRFFAGYANGSDELWRAIAPMPEIEGANANIIGRFWLLLQALADCHLRLKAERSALAWQTDLNAVLDRFFVEQGEESGAVQSIRDALAHLSERVGPGIVSRELLRHWLQSQLREQSARGRYFSGGVTFCGMRPMRCLPFRVIGLLGMNDADFPRREQATEFDLMQSNWRPGDPSKGEEDRYLFLETLLCARDILYISYIGRDLRDNSERQPSILVQELLDFIDRTAASHDGCPDKISQILTRQHPMQAFSPRNFAPENAAYDQHWHRIAKTLSESETHAPRTGWPRIQLAPPAREKRRIDLFRVHGFLNNPVRFFFTTRLKIRLDSPIAREDNEPFDLDGLTRWHLKSILSRDYLYGRALHGERFQAQGLLPHGSLGALALKKTQEETAPLLVPLAEYRGLLPEAREIKLRFPDDYDLVGKISGFYPQKGLLHFTPSKFKGSHLLALWLDQLCVAASGKGDALPARLLCRDQDWLIPPLTESEARSYLDPIIEAFIAALRGPPAILPAASYAWAACQFGGKQSDARKKAFSAWEGVPFLNIPGDQHDLYLHLALRETLEAPIDDPEFARCSIAFYEDVLSRAQPI